MRLNVKVHSVGWIESEIKLKNQNDYSIHLDVIDRGDGLQK